LSILNLCKYLSVFGFLVSKPKMDNLDFTRTYLLIQQSASFWFNKS
jgi:hypothetical protein